MVWNGRSRKLHAKAYECDDRNHSSTHDMAAMKAVWTPETDYQDREKFFLEA